MTLIQDFNLFLLAYKINSVCSSQLSIQIIDIMNVQHISFLTFIVFNLQLFGKG